MRSEPPIPHATGLKPTIRQLMIGVLWAGLLSAALRLMLEWGVFAQPVAMILLNLVIWIAIGPGFLACVLLYFFDREGPVRSWYIQVCQACGGVLTSTSFLSVGLASFLLTGQASILILFAPVIGLGMMWFCTMHLRNLWPKRCPSCGRHAVITIETTLGDRPHYRSKTWSWCAACGQDPEPEKGKPWWLDENLGDSWDWLPPESEADTSVGLEA